MTVCKNRPKNELIRRRDLLTAGAASVAASSLARNALAARAASAPDTRSPADALNKLKIGNEKYVRNPKLCAINLEDQRQSAVASQAPWATIVSCADSRVPPELIFGGRGVGELFVARNAGNLVGAGTLGTVEYGAAVLGTPLIVVLAHTGCGAVKAACDVVSRNATYPGAIGSMIEPIVPAALAVQSAPGNYVDNTARESTKRTAARLAAMSPLIAGLVETGKVKVVAAIYDLQTGVVTYLD